MSETPPIPDIVVTLDVMLAKRKMKAQDFAAIVGITEANLSVLRSGKVKGVRFETLARICTALECRPGDILDIDVAQRDWPIGAVTPRKAARSCPVPGARRPG